MNTVHLSFLIQTSGYINSTKIIKYTDKNANTYLSKNPRTIATLKLLQKNKLIKCFFL